MPIELVVTFKDETKKHYYIPTRRSSLRHGIRSHAKVSQFSLLPQGKIEANERVLNMVKQMDEEGFGNCTNTGACEVECPKGISLENIARMNRDFLKAKISS